MRDLIQTLNSTIFSNLWPTLLLCCVEQMTFRDELLIAMFVNDLQKLAFLFPLVLSMTIIFQ